MAGQGKMQKEKHKTDGTQKGNRSMYTRFVAVFLVFLLAAGGLGYELFLRQVTQAAEWKARASNQQLQSTVIEPLRGTVYDSQMNALAESAVVWTVEAYPDVMAKSRLKDTAEKDPARLAAAQLAGIEELGLDEAVLYQNLSDSKKQYHLIKKQIEKPYADQIREICATYGISGIYLRQDTKRYYPYEDLAGAVLGFVGSDGQGVEGLEWQYNEQLSGTPGRLITAHNATGGEMPSDEDSVTYPAEDGNSLVLTINTDIQKSVEDNLTKAVEKYSAAERGMAIVMDVNTGAILAMATKPDFNPNEPYVIFDAATRQAVEEMPENTDEEKQAKQQAESDALNRQWRNKAVSDSYEPGSVFKTITAAAALDSGVCTPDTLFTCAGEYNMDGWDEPFKCANNAVHATIPLSTALIESCNISFIQIGQKLGVSTWYDYVNAFGLTEPTGVDLPGEPSLSSIGNVVYSEAKMGPIQLASCSFGQSNKYTALQIITAFSASVNGGYLVQPHVVDKVINSEGAVVQQTENHIKRQVISNETSRQLCDTMEQLVADSSNSGSSAFVAGYHVGGKSGTSQKLEKLPTEEVYISSFMGFAPADNPRIAVLFVLDEPIDTTAPGRPTYFGGRLAGPWVGNIIADSVKILGIEPDYGEEEWSRSTVSAPALVGQDVDKSQALLNSSGLSPKVIGSGGTVTAQYPEAGMQVPRGGFVVVYTDEGATGQTVTMPNLAGKSARQAIDSLKSIGLNVLTRGAPDDGANVVVVEQSIAFETEVRLGTVVELQLQNLSSTGDH